MGLGQKLKEVLGGGHKHKDEDTSSTHSSQVATDNLSTGRANTAIDKSTVSPLSSTSGQTAVGGGVLNPTPSHHHVGHGTHLPSTGTATGGYAGGVGGPAGGAGIQEYAQDPTRSIGPTTVITDGAVNQPTATGMSTSAAAVPGASHTLNTMHNSSVTEDVREVAAGGSMWVGTPEWQKARELTRKAELESASASIKSQTAVKKANEAAAMYEELQQSQAVYDQAIRKLRELEAQRPDVAGIAAVADQATGLAQKREADLNLTIKEAQLAADEARARYDEAKLAIARMEEKQAQLAQLAAAADEKRRAREAALSQRTPLEQEVAELSRVLEGKRAAEASALAEMGRLDGAVRQLEQELLAARARADGKSKELMQLQGAVQTTDAALRSKHAELQRFEAAAVAAKRDLAPLEAQLTEEQSALLAAQQTAQHKAQLAEAARNEALAKKAEAEGLSAKTNELKTEAEAKRREAEEARRIAAEHAAAMRPLQAQAAAAVKRADETRSLAVSHMEEWEHQKQEMEVHKARTRELWEEAKKHGEVAVVDVTAQMKDLQAKLQEQAPDMVVPDLMGSGSERMTNESGAHRVADSLAERNTRSGLEGSSVSGRNQTATSHDSGNTRTHQMTN